MTGGTDNHLIVIDFTDTGLDGKQAEELLDRVGISTSKSTIPDDPNPPFRPSGLRIGMPAMTTRGFREPETTWLVEMIDKTLRSDGDDTLLHTYHDEVIEMAKKYPLPG